MAIRIFDPTAHGAIQKCNYFWCIIGINCGENVKNRCEGCEAGGIKLKFVVNYIIKMVSNLKNVICKTDEIQTFL